MKLIKDMDFDEFVAKFFMIPVFVLLGIMMFIVLPLFGVPVRHKAVIKAFEWERTTYIQEYQTVRKEGWYLPEGAKEVSRELKKKEDIFSRDEDLYSHWYVYDINEWVNVKEYQDNGEGKKPYSVDKRTLDIPKKSEVNEPQLGDKCQCSDIDLIVIAQPKKDESELTFKESDDWGIVHEAKDKRIGDKISYGSETNVWNLIFS
jgi:hypothetical protein